MKYDKLKIWFEFLTEFRKQGYRDSDICEKWEAAEMFLDGESLSKIISNHSLGKIQEVTNWLEANNYLPEKYYTPLNIS